MKPDLSRRSASGAKAERDQQLDRALTQELRAMSTPAGDHVDAETLAAWADGGLDAATMASVEIHVSSCPRCQSIAGVMTRSEPVVAASPRSPFRIPAWWIPIAAGAAAATIWMVVPQQREPATTPAPAPAVSAEPSLAPPAVASAAPLQQQARDAVAPAPKDRVPAREDRQERAAFADNKLQEPLAKRQEAAPPKENAETLQREPQKDASAAGAMAAAPPRAAAPAAMEQQAAVTRAPIEIVSPDASRRWRVAAAAIERSEDRGATWVIVRPAGSDVITGGIAPSASICWLIGRSGLVLVTADGATFARVPLPEAIDLASVSATDARSATVTAVDGRRFRTDDSGRTWRLIQA